MNTYEYITKAGTPNRFQTTDDATALKTVGTFGDRDPASGVRLVTATPTAPGAPAAPSAPDYSAAAKNAGAAGLSETQYAASLGATPEEQKAARDAIAKQFGYADSDSFFSDVFQKPSQTTEQFYQDAFKAAGLDTLTASIASKRNALNAALGTVNDNPWYDEAFRRGEASRLQTLANGDIANLEKDYNLRLGSVHDLVTRHADDMAGDEKLNAARLKYLEETAKSTSDTTAATRATKYLPDYVAGKKTTEKPQTVTIPKSGTVLVHDPVTNTWKTLGTGGGATSAPSTSKAPALTNEQKTIASFTKALANRTAITKAGTREQFARQLQAQFPNINPDQISAAVYKTYPDHFDGK